MTPEGQWLESQNTDEHKRQEAHSNFGLYTVTHDMVSHATLLTIFDKSIAAAFKLAYC